MLIKNGHLVKVHTTPASGLNPMSGRVLDISTVGLTLHYVAKGERECVSLVPWAHVARVEVPSLLKTFS